MEKSTPYYNEILKYFIVKCKDLIFYTYEKKNSEQLFITLFIRSLLKNSSRDHFDLTY